MSTVLEARALVKEFTPRGSGLGLFRRSAPFRAVDGFDLALATGEAVALVGESGAGKTTVGRMLARLEQPTAGSIELNGIDATRLSGGALRPFRRGVQIVFQNPYESLDPRHRVLAAVSEPLEIHRMDSSAGRRSRSIAALEAVGLRPASRYLHRLPHELSGGQRQRVAIARAIVLEPTFVVLDEPTSALDSSSEAVIQDALGRMKGSVLLVVIAHRLSTLDVCDRLIVIEDGRVADDAPAKRVLAHSAYFSDPRKRALLELE